MEVVATWKQWPWGHFPCPVPAGEKTTASMCYVAYCPYLRLNPFLSQAICCFCFGGAWSIGTDVTRKMPLERQYVFTWGQRMQMQHRRTCFPSGSLPVQRRSARLTFRFEIPDISNSRQAVGQGVSICVDFKLSYFNWRGRMSVVWGFLQRFSEIKPALTVMLIVPIKPLHLSKNLS